MAKLSTTLNKLARLGIPVRKESLGPTDFYYFSINDGLYEFTNQPCVDCKARDLCRTFDNGSSPSYYTSLAELLRFSER